MRTTALAVAVVVACVLGAGSTAQAADRYEPLAMRVMLTPHWFTDPAGRDHLVYELSLTTASRCPCR